MNNHVEVRFGGDTSEYQRALGGLTNDAKGAAASIGKAFAAIGITALATRFARSTIEWASSASIAARNVGLLTEEMIALNRVGLQSGVGVDKMQRMMAKLQTELFRSAQGVEESQKKFDALGVDFRDIAAMNPADQLRAVARAAIEAGTPVALLSRLFGEELGPTAMVALRDIAENGLPAVESAVGDAADAVEDLQSRWGVAFDLMKQKLVGLSGELHEMVSGLGAFWGGFFGGPGTITERIDRGWLAMADDYQSGQQQARDRRAKREQERAAQIAEMQRVAEEVDRRRRAEEDAADYEATLRERERKAQTKENNRRAMEQWSAARGTVEAPQFDALRRMGAMTSGGVAQAREPLQLDRDRNRLLKLMVDSLKNIGTEAAPADFAMR